VKWVFVAEFNSWIGIEVVVVESLIILSVVVHNLEGFVEGWGSYPIDNFYLKSLKFGGVRCCQKEIEMIKAILELREIRGFTARPDSNPAEGRG